MKLNLTYVNRTQRMSKANKPFTSISIKTTQYGDKYISGFGGKDNEGWKVGDEVEVAGVSEKQVNGKPYMNFEMPRSARSNVDVIALSHDIKVVQGQLARIIDHLSGKQLLNEPRPMGAVPTSIDYPPEEINPEDIPF